MPFLNSYNGVLHHDLYAIYHELSELIKRALHTSF